MRAVALVALALAGATLPVALLGEGRSPQSRPAAGAVIGTVPLQRARCSDWVGASSAERRATSAALRRAVGGATPYGPANTLSSQAATRLFDRTCASSFADGFLLYELYIRAAGFGS